MFDEAVRNNNTKQHKVVYKNFIRNICLVKKEISSKAHAKLLKILILQRLQKQNKSRNETKVAIADLYQWQSD
jgi:hypothetical protein